MAELKLTTLTLPAADLGVENPLAPLTPPGDAHAQIRFGSGVPEEIRRQVGYGRHPGCLPYRLQDGYNRDRKPRVLRVAVLQNEFLRATFLLEYGGRLASLVHLPTQRELLAANPVFQPANLAIRNAWFSGGVEWNIGVIGHSPFTCAPLHAERLTAPGGLPVLRLREWERIRQTPFQLDIWLPDQSPFLFVRVAIRNPNDHEVPMYWWSNIAVPETPGSRAQSIPIYERGRSALTFQLGQTRGDVFLDEVRIWTVARSLVELDENRTQLIQTGTPGLFRCFRFDDGGMTIEDFAHPGWRTAEAAAVHTPGTQGRFELTSIAPDAC